MPQPAQPPRAAQKPPGAPQAKRPARTQKSPGNRSGLLLVAGIGLLLGMVGLFALVVLVSIVLVSGSDEVLPGVHAVGVDLGGLSKTEAADTLAIAWASGIRLRDGERTWRIPPDDMPALGITLDSDATADAAKNWGGLFDALQSLVSPKEVQIEPVLHVDLEQLRVYLQENTAQVNLPAKNAGVQLVNGQAVATLGENGRTLDLAATLDVLRVDAAGELADGALDLVMITTPPAITDASALVAQANTLLTSPFMINAYDPVRDQVTSWAALPETWATWLAADSAPDSPTGLHLTLHADGPKALLEEANSSFGDERYIKIDEAVSAMQTALAQQTTTTTIRVWHHPTTYTVQGGQTLAAIGEEVGIPYPYIQAENPGINTNALSAGQVLTLPSRDVLLPLDPVPNKRIIIYRGQQRLEAYENGQLVFDWTISTGISTSPTALGVFQVQSHELNAYADQWNLYMPHFIGFYHPGPQANVMNGFHGFPTRLGGYLLWTNDLGRPATYGCVLLSMENAETLYHWAEEGVVVEVRA